jgi:hypothetical protein
MKEKNLLSFFNSTDCFNFLASFQWHTIENCCQYIGRKKEVEFAHVRERGLLVKYVRRCLFSQGCLFDLKIKAEFFRNTA